MVEDYELLDSGDGRKLERFGKIVLARPCSQAMWRPQLPQGEWNRATASFDREDGNNWHGRANLPKEWTIETAGVKFKLGGTDFGHLGIFPEQRAQWRWIRETCQSYRGASSPAAGNSPSPLRVLNLFAYSGGSRMIASYLRSRRISRRMNLCASSTIQRIGLSASPLSRALSRAHSTMPFEASR